MTNREKILKTNIYDLMIAIRRNGHKFCPIEIVGAAKPNCLPSIYGLAQTNCEKCIQQWLNEGVIE
jgi:hypothetical protein